ncbi:rolling stone [Elysia marginata]|uniref:Rolling stone n=1 Tax=Elysia marginata TaxID=1093978 RepID=A0AAV4EQ16_9GAST|nr:rolling stone [Elysia marginata]
MPALFVPIVESSTDGGVKWFIYFSHITFLVTVVSCTCDLVGAVRAGPITSKPSSQVNKSVKMEDFAITYALNPIDGENKVTRSDSIRHSDKEEILFRGEFTVIEGLKEAPTARLSQITWFLYSVINTSSILSSAWFWAVTYDSHTYAVEMVAHVTNSVFVIGNLLVSALPVRLLHFVYPAVYTGLYIAFTGIYRAAGGSDEDGRDVIYRPLDWDDSFPTALTVAVGLLVVVPLLHCVTFAAYTFRVYLHARVNSASYAPSAEFEAKVSAIRFRPEDKAGASARLENDLSSSLDTVGAATSSSGGNASGTSMSCDLKYGHGHGNGADVGNNFNNPT